MDPLRTRRADAAPGLGQEEYYGRHPQNVTGDADMGTAAKVLYDAITLDMAIERTPGGSMATNARLAFLAGMPQGRNGERWTSRRLKELVARGHVAVTRNRQIAGSPRLISPTAKLRGIRPHTPDCTQTNLSAQETGRPDLHPDKFVAVHPDKFVADTPQDCRPSPPNLSRPILYGETESKREQQQDAETAENEGVRPVVVLPAVAREESRKPPPGTRTIDEAIADLEKKLVQRFPNAHPDGRARKRPGEPTAKCPPEASRSANPGSQEFTTEPASSATTDDDTDHEC